MAMFLSKLEVTALADWLLLLCNTSALPCVVAPFFAKVKAGMLGNVTLPVMHW